AANLPAAAEAHLEKPVGIGERLARGGDDVGLAGGEDRFGLIEAVDAAGDDGGRVEPRGAHGVAYGGDERNLAAERAALVGDIARHALVAALAGVGVGGFADLGLRGVVELAALRQRQVVEAGARELDGEVDGVVDAGAAFDDLVAEEARADAAVAHARADGGDDLERQTDARLARAAVAVVARVLGR